MTVDDALVYELPGITHVLTASLLGPTMTADPLQAMMADDPDVLMIGELAGEDMTRAAVRAALAGRLVLSSLRAPDAAGAVIRLLDMGIEPFELCATLTGMLSQRLVRHLCERCRRPTQVSLESLRLPVPPPATSGGVVRVWHAQGCETCHGIGYHGCTGIGELLIVDSHMRSLIFKRAPAAQFRQSAMSRGMINLWQAGWQKVQAGLTSLPELLRVLPRDLR